MKNTSGCLVFVVATVIAIISFSFGFLNKHIFGNKQIFDFKQTFNVAYIELPGNERLKVHVSKWNDYENSDSIQIIDVNGKVYYTHLNRIVLSKE